VFWGPMAFAIMGGLLVGTLLTLIFLPTLFLAWFGGKEAPADALPLAPVHERGGPDQQTGTRVLDDARA